MSTDAPLSVYAYPLGRLLMGRLRGVCAHAAADVEFMISHEKGYHAIARGMAFYVEDNKGATYRVSVEAQPKEKVNGINSNEGQEEGRPV